MIETDLAIETDLVEIHFAAGLPGFPNARRYVLAPWGGPESPFMTMSSTSDPDIGFVVVAPWVFYPDYEFDLDALTAERLALSDWEAALVVCMVTLADQAEDATVNLLGPIVINSTTHEACQAVLASSGYEVRAPLARAA
jgi:flagellar assembly factor FliW